MSPDQIPQKEGEPASEKIAQAEQLVAAYVPSLRLGTLIFEQEDLVALHNLLADAKARAVAQEAEGRRLRDALDDFSHAAHAVLGGDSIVGVTDEDRAHYLHRLAVLAGTWDRPVQNPSGGAALSGSSETP